MTGIVVAGFADVFGAMADIKRRNAQLTRGNRAAADGFAAQGIGGIIGGAGGFMVATHALRTGSVALVSPVGWMLVIVGALVAIGAGFYIARNLRTPIEHWLQHCYWGEQPYAADNKLAERGRPTVYFGSWKDDPQAEIKEFFEIVYGFELKLLWRQFRRRRNHDFGPSEIPLSTRHYGDIKPEDLSDELDRPGEGLSIEVALPNQTEGHGGVYLRLTFQAPPPGAELGGRELEEVVFIGGRSDDNGVDGLPLISRNGSGSESTFQVPRGQPVRLRIAEADNGLVVMRWFIHAMHLPAGARSARVEIVYDPYGDRRGVIPSYDVLEATVSAPITHRPGELSYGVRKTSYGIELA
ncbi:hypothetical protein CAI21_09605 [Alkalilimnicola ehrlichii]|uniref:Uncharacterized protein n=1 Tax=Alkalilimnicola ehrlichii TaxID=351052 RepID=A0A3E0WV26_9GAMM|nr:hypothetical protein [Alkalilimnicola ehrlichii]RFA29320.1 hypothetical protein CAI21_09605 [Alkalilimnicola ehrlichii]RFA36834.1 hypothetical protein CAL65_09940 [Alkalilimnicola ehrlichii]